MMNLRCTQKLLRRLNLPEDMEAGETTTALGDWYATILFTRPAHIVLCMSERSRLCVPLFARDIDRFPVRFRQELRQLLRELSVSQEAVDREVKEMEPLCYAPTTGPAVSRSVLGSLNDYTNMLKVHMEHESWTLGELAVKLSKVPCGPLQGRYPRDVARELFQARVTDCLP
jgi:hypothetical protein